MTEGAVEDCETYRLFRYDDCWWAIWKNPKPDNLGRILNTERELRLFMGGNYSAGLNLGTPDIRYST